MANPLQPLTLHVGTSGFAYTKWKPSFYPADLPSKQFLHYYSRQFRSVEINSTFYTMPTAVALKPWLAEVPPDFSFTLKAPQRITHIKRLKECEDLLKEFLTAAVVLKKQRGPLLFQLPPNMKADLPRLKAFLKLLPKKLQVAFEFRHASWFNDETYALLRKLNVALCIADAEGDLKVPFVATADWGYLRLRRDDYDAHTLKAWARRVQEQDWSDAYVYFKHEETGNGPRFARQFLKSL
ncbi:DUF72 domain-containing protein [soil metagenome]